MLFSCYRHIASFVRVFVFDPARGWATVCLQNPGILADRRRERHAADESTMNKLLCTQCQTKLLILVIQGTQFMHDHWHVYIHSPNAASMCLFRLSLDGMYDVD